MPETEVAEAMDAPGRCGVETVRISTAIAAKIAGLSVRWLTDQRHNGCPVPDGGVRTVDQVAAIVKWRMAELRESLGPDELDDIDDLDREEKKTKLKVTQVKLSRELDLVLDEGPYIHHLTVLWSEANSLLDSMGRKLAPFIAGMTDEDEIRDKIDDFVNDVKRRFNADEALKPATAEYNPFTDEVVTVDDDDDGLAGDDEDD